MTEHTILADALRWLGYLLVNNADTWAVQLIAGSTFIASAVGLVSRVAPLALMTKPLWGPVAKIVQPWLAERWLALTAPKDGKQ